MEEIMGLNYVITRTAHLHATLVVYASMHLQQLRRSPPEGSECRTEDDELSQLAEEVHRMHQECVQVKVSGRYDPSMVPPLKSRLDQIEARASEIVEARRENIPKTFVPY
jgi:hypothetical protein